MADNTYTNISDLPTLESVDQTAWTPVEIEGKEGKKVDLSKFADKDELDDKADKSQMSISAVSGDSTKKTIQLKEGTSADVVVAHQDVTGKADKVSDAVSGNIPKLDGNGNLVDSGISSENVANVKPDWNAEAGTAAEILNKPTIPATGYTRVNLGNIADAHVVIPVHNRDSITTNLTCDILVSSITLDLSDDADDAIVLCHLTNGRLIHSDDLSIKRGNKSLIVVYPPIPNQSYCTHSDTLVTTVYGGSGSAEVPTDFSQMRTGIAWGSAPTDLASNLLHESYVLENAHHILFRIVADYCFIHILPNN